VPEPGLLGLGSFQEAQASGAKKTGRLAPPGLA
jgi:hypothetical protein